MGLPIKDISRAAKPLWQRGKYYAAAALIGTTISGFSPPSWAFDEARLQSLLLSQSPQAASTNSDDSQISAAHGQLPVPKIHPERRLPATKLAFAPDLNRSSKTATAAAEKDATQSAIIPAFKPLSSASGGHKAWKKRPVLYPKTASRQRYAQAAHYQPAVAGTLPRLFDGIPVPVQVRPVPATKATRQPQKRTVNVESGDSLFHLLTSAGAHPAQANEAISALKRHYDPRQLKIGQTLTMVFDAAIAPPRLDRLTLATTAHEQVTIERYQDEIFAGRSEARALERRLERASGRIENSLHLAAKRSGLPLNVLDQMTQLFSYEVDFEREIQPGDRFDVLYERLYDEAGSEIGIGHVLYALLRTGDKSRALYRFEDSRGIAHYFDEHGHSVRRDLMMTPVDGARLTSRFGMRRHPILRYTRMHPGVDFAAPRGTPVMAAGDGRIEYLGRNGAYGRYIRIRHNGSLKTAYAHLYRYGKKLKKGDKVKQGQIIGYVGASGRATGAHLHYEVIRNGKHVNPLKLKLPKGKRLSGTELAIYQRHQQAINGLIASIAATQTLAQN